MKNVFLAIVAGAIAFFLFGCCWAMQIDRHRTGEAYSYYSEIISTADGDELDEASLAVGFLHMTGELTDEQHAELENLYRQRNEEGKK